MHYAAAYVNRVLIFEPRTSCCTNDAVVKLNPPWPEHFLTSLYRLLQCLNEFNGRPAPLWISVFHKAFPVTTWSLALFPLASLLPTTCFGRLSTTARASVLSVFASLFPSLPHVWPYFQILSTLLQAFYRRV